MKRIALVLTLLLAGCSFFSKSQSKFYTLDRLPPSAPAVATRGLPIAIDGVELPPGLDRREIVVRLANQQLQVRSNEQWSASLQPLVLHTLASDLADRLPEGMVILPGASRPSGALRAIDVVFEDFTAGPDAKVVLDGRWIVRTSGQPDMTHHERISIDIASLDSANIASGTSQALAALADRMAAALR
jgi:uncharacterized lipoprotein YmbA